MSNPAPPPDLEFLDSLAEALAGTWPAAQAANALHAAHTALEGLQPRDLVDAMLAARIIAAHHATMDAYRRAMQPDAGNAESARLISNAGAAARSFDSALCALEKRRAPAESAWQSHHAASFHRHHLAAEAESPEADELASFTPEEVAAAEHALDNDPIKLQQAELAKRIPLHRWQDMTMEERRIAYAPSAPLSPVQIAVLGERMAARTRSLPEPHRASG